MLDMKNLQTQLRKNTYKADK